MKKRLFLVVSYFGLAAIVSMATAAGRFVHSGGPGEDELGQIERSIKDCIGWAKIKDFRLLYSVIANDPDFLEVHPDGTVIKGFDEFKKAEKLWGSPDFKAVRYEVRDLRIRRSKSGDVAWFFCLLDDINEWKGQPANWENTRWTGVLEKRDGRWVMVQQHFSFGSEEPLVLTYVANSGALVVAGDIKVLVDALFDKPNPEYRAPAPAVLEKIMNGTAPYDGVDLVLVTHNHPDHFEAHLAVRYLETLPEPLLLAPADAVEEMRKAAADWPKIEPRVIPLDIKVGEKDRRDLKKVSLTAFRTRHSGDRDSPMNLMYLFEMDGWRVFQEGDSTGKPGDFQGFELGAAPVDLALVHYWFPLEPNCARFLQEVLKPGHIALTHLPVRLEGEAPGKIDLVRQYYEDIFLLLPGMPSKVLQKGN